MMAEPLLPSSPFQGSQPARIWLGTYDLNGTTVGERDVAQLSKWFHAQKTKEYDVVVMGFQGIKTPKKPSRGYSYPLEAVVEKCLNLTAENTTNEYSLLSYGQESGTHLMVFVNSSIPFPITEVEVATVVLRRSTFSEKLGAVGIRAAFNKTTVCFVTAKFAGGFADYDERNREYAMIAEKLQFAMNLRGIDDHDAVFWAGNFNYRIGLAWGVVMDRIKRAEVEERKELGVLYENDQLVVQMSAGLVFSYYSEAIVRFAPTSTFQVGSDAYLTESIPAWTGRILRKSSKVKQVAYDSVEDVRISDQRPVYAAFELEVNPQAKMLNRKPVPQPEKKAQPKVEETASVKDDFKSRSPQPRAPKPSVPTIPLEESIRIETWSGDRNLQRTHEFLHEIRDGKYWQTKKHRRRVRVAILDSGIDVAHPEIAARSERIVETFCPIPGFEDQGNQDKGGHGTHIALLLLQIAPMVDLYIARVFEDAKRVTNDHVGGAILHAVNEWQVDVIIMSFGFKFWVPSISRAIRVAAFNDVLMFAAASNEGANADIDLAYPARETNVLDIRATDHLGNRYMYNPPWDAGARWTFATLGEKVLSAWTEGQMLPKSGTSMAAAIAAGAAALLLDFSRLPALRGQAPRHLEHVASFDGMRLLLEACSSRTPDNLLYIKPWLVFSKKGFDRSRIANYIDDVLDEHFG